MNGRWRTMGIGPRLTAAFLAVAFLTLASGIIGLLGFWQASIAARILSENSEMIRTVQEIRTAVGPLQGPPADFILMGDAAAPRRYAEALEQVAETIETYELAHRDHSHSVEHGASAEALVAMTQADVRELSRLGDRLFTGSDNEAALALTAEMDTILAGLSRRLEELLANAEEDIRAAEERHSTAQRGAYIGLTASALLAFSLAVALAFGFTRSISRPLAELVAAADRIIEGDLSTPIEVTGSGEIGQLAESFERMRLTVVRERGQVRLLAVLEERDRIGRELHDGLAQILGYVNTKAQAVHEFLRADELEAASRQLQELINAAQEAYTDAREIIVGLRMNAVQDRALADLTEEYVARFKRQSGVAAELTITPAWNDQAVPETVKVQTLRIIQEALTNARKHAQASLVSVTLDKSDGTALVTVEDNGRGFMLSRLLRPDFSRYGLRTMRERAQAVGGSLRIESAPGKGTCIMAALPLAQEIESVI